MADKAGERHLELLEALEELAKEDPDGVAHMHEAAQRVGLDSVGVGAAREEFVTLVRDLEEDGNRRRHGAGRGFGLRRLLRRLLRG